MTARVLSLTYIRVLVQYSTYLRHLARCSYHPRGKQRNLMLQQHLIYADLGRRNVVWGARLPTWSELAAGPSWSRQNPRPLGRYTYTEFHVHRTRGRRCLAHRHPTMQRRVRPDAHSVLSILVMSPCRILVSGWRYRFGVRRRRKASDGPRRLCLRVIIPNTAVFFGYGACVIQFGE